MKKHLLQREQFCALLFCFVSFLTFYGRNCQAGEAAQPSTFCNPLNLPYRFSLESRHGERRPIPRSFVNWSSPVASGSGTSAVTTIAFPPQTARFIRVTQTTNGFTILFWSMHEFNVNGQ